MRNRRCIASVSAIVWLAGVLAFPVSAPAQEVLNATVTRVVDGDTVKVRLATGASTTVRLLGIDAPESVAPATPVECGGEEASAFLTRLVEGRDVLLTTDPSQDRTDRFGRLLAYVDAGATDVGLAVVRAGHGEVFVFQQRPFARLAVYQQAEAEASGASRGVWEQCDGNFHTPQTQSEDAVSESRSESAERFVRRYYFLLNQRRFSTAWTKLSPGLRRRFGPYASRRGGFRRTVGTRINSASVSLAGGKAVVRVAIRARDRDACNRRVVRQFFRVRWVLSPREGSWVATTVTARKIGGGTPRLQRSQCAAPRRPRPSPPSTPDRPGPQPGPNCDPNYSGCLNPNASDYDCRGGSGDGPLYTGPVTDKGDDHYGLDADGDGVGCET